MCVPAFGLNVYIPSLQHLLLELRNLNCADNIHTQTHDIQSRGGFATMLIHGDIIHEWHIPHQNPSITLPILTIDGIRVKGNSIRLGSILLEITKRLLGTEE